MNTRKIAPLVASMAALALFATGCASTSSDPGTSAQGAELNGTSEYGTGNMADFCPKEPMKVAYAKGSNNSWTTITLAEMRDEAAKCDTITEVIFTDAQGNQQQAISDINSLVAQGVKAIVVQPEFGQAQIPALRAAHDADIGVATLISSAGGVVGEDYDAEILEDTDASGRDWVKWLDATIGEGSVAFLGGVPGAASSAQFFDGVKKALADYPKLKLVSDSVIDTNWDAGQKKRVVSGLLAQHGRIDAFITDYGLTDTGVIDAYKEAGLELPAIATNASGNANGCQWEEENYPFMGLEETTSFGRIALRKAVAAAEGIENPEPAVVQMPTIIDTTNGKNPRCDKSLPADVDLSSTLSTEKLKELFQ
ncbi:substrate-binding domain-containing protein [Glutamicibacter sp. NPDC087344]|uniref:substrate-binding domain-containing protein n=1 Tax=Glutamicibacter sp. NPDC087344 TaxID=3363994 RepID=UPI0037F20BB4